MDNFLVLEAKIEPTDKKRILGQRRAKQRGTQNDREHATQETNRQKQDDPQGE